MMRRRRSADLAGMAAILALVCPCVALASPGDVNPNLQQAAARGELIERTLALVGNQVITLSDVQTAIALGLVERPADSKTIDEGTARLIDRLLILREVQRYAPPEPADADIDAKLAVIRARFPNPADYRAALDAGGFTETTVRVWVRDDLRIASYLGQRFAAANVPADDEVKAYYASHRGEFDPNRIAFDEAAPAIRERLTAERRRALIDDWIADLRRRTPVVELWKR